MRICLVAHSFIMISAVFASQIHPVRIVRRQITEGATTQTSLTSIPVQSPPTGVTTTSLTTVTPPVSQSPTSSTTLTPSLTSATTTSLSTISTTSTNSISTTASASPSVTSASSVVSTVTDSQGQVSTVVVLPSSSTALSSETSPPVKSNDSDSGIHPGTIIGLSVAGGIAAIAIIGFIVWKLTRKRFTDLDDPNEAIKWPELNRDHVGGSNTDGLSREVSNYSSGALSRDLASEHSDPYAVPPLPQFNPSQPYRDDPHAASHAGYYDPYRGPVPQSLHDDSMDGHENIPMNAYPSNTRTRSPGPALSFDMGGRGSPAPAPGRASPGPGLAYNVGSPAPGRTMSPAAPALGADRRASPGPQYALSGQP